MKKDSAVLFTKIFTLIVLCFVMILSLSILSRVIASDSESGLADGSSVKELILRGNEAAGKGELDDAESAYLEAADLQRKISSESMMMAKILTNLGAITSARGTLDKAEKYYLLALRIMEKESPDSLELGMLLTNLGSIASARGQFREAVDSYQKALLILRKVAPEDDGTIAALSNLAMIERESGDNAAAAKTYREVLSIQERRHPGSPAHASVLTTLGTLAKERGAVEEAESLWTQALAMEEKIDPASPYVSQIMGNLGIISHEKGELQKAEGLFQRALAIETKRAAVSFEVARLNNHLAMIEQDRGNLESAENLISESLRMQESLVPGSLESAESLSNLGHIALVRGDMNKAAEYIERAYFMRSSLAPGSSSLISSLTDMGNVAYDRGDLQKANLYYREALDRERLINPESAAVAVCLNNLGGVALQRGDFANAESSYSSSRVLLEKMASQGPALARCLNNLGIIAAIRLDYELAYNYFSQAIELWERVSKQNLEQAKSLTNRGDVERARGDLDKAERDHLLSLTILRAAAPESEAMIHGLHNLADVLKEKGNRQRARELYQDAYAASEKRAPGTMNSSYPLLSLGILAREEKKYEEARSFIHKSLSIRQRLSPKSIHIVECLHQLGLIEREENNLQKAESFFRQAVDLFEEQRMKLGGSRENWQEFRAHHADYYDDLLDMQVQLKTYAEAFHTLERSRARVLLELLAERDIDVSQEIPPDLIAQRRDNDRDYDRIQQEILLLNPQEGEKIATLLEQLTVFERKRNEVAESIKKKSPRLAALQYPEPLNLTDMEKRGTLDPGTILLAYNVGQRAIHLFVITAGDPGGKLSCEVHSLTIDNTTLTNQVRLLLRLIRMEKLTPMGENLCRTLYDELVLPAESRIATGQRVLIVPDGPLHYLPFSVLMRGPGDKETDDEAAAEQRFFSLWKPLHTIVSLSIYDDLKQKRKRERPIGGSFRLIAFGSPDYQPVSDQGSPDTADPDLRSAILRGLKLTPLPGTKVEIEDIENLYGKAATAFIGAEATEERAKDVTGEASIIHFACHGLIDELFPLNSALALTIPRNPQADTENGLLQAWEIFQDVRIDADLVTLSACGTAQGTMLGGEGVIGLTRAFQFAGATSILASLWSVSDASTARLMHLFYQHLKDGVAKDQALQAAQRTLIGEKSETTGENAFSPFHWAAFTLIGDWK